MKTLRKYLLIALASLSLLLVSGYCYLSYNTYQPTDQALAFSKNAKKTEGNLFFESIGQTKASLIFYQGALVEVASYAEMAELLSQRGYDVYLLDTPFNLPILSSKKALDILSDVSTPVYLSGHSMGGVVASMASQETDQVDGLILLASYPSDKTDLSQSNLGVLSITAGHDKVLNWDKYEDTKKRLPDNTDYQTITNGNHASFGDYGAQKGDGKAELSSSEQISEVVDMIDNFILAH